MPLQSTFAAPRFEQRERRSQSALGAARVRSGRAAISERLLHHPATSTCMPLYLCASQARVQSLTCLIYIPAALFGSHREHRAAYSTPCWADELKMSDLRCSTMLLPLCSLPLASPRSRSLKCACEASRFTFDENEMRVHSTKRILHEAVATAQLLFVGAQKLSTAALELCGSLERFQ
jgi:hypothetical protein